jgi:hypothetical protein
MMRRAQVVLVLVLVLAGCGNRSMLAPELDQGISEVDAAVRRGDVEVACARLAQVVPRFADWAGHARGERAAVGNQLLEQLSGLTASCSTPGGGNLTSAWPPIHAEIRRISSYRTSWLTVFTYVSMLAVGIGVYLFLRRAKRE